MSGIRLLLVGPYSLPGGSFLGGVASSTRAIVDAIYPYKEIEHICVLTFSSQAKKIKSYEINEKVKVIHIPGQQKLILPTRSVLNKLAAKKFMREQSFDLVYAQGLDHNGDIAVSLGLPTVVTVHGVMADEVKLLPRTFMNKGRLVLVNQMVESIQRKAKSIIAISRYSKSALKVKNPEVTIIPYPLQDEFINDDEEIIRSTINSKRLAYLGWISPLKNISGLIDAFSIVVKNIPEAELVIAGGVADSAYWEMVKQKISSLNLSNKVKYLGVLESVEVKRTALSSRLLVHFSNQENLPNSIMEAAALGRPVIATEVGGIPDLVEDGYNGYLVEKNNTKEFAQKVINLLSSDHLTLEMGERGFRKSRSEFTPQAIAPKIVDVLTRVSENHLP